METKTRKPRKIEDKPRKPREKTQTGKIMSLLTLLNPGDFFYTERPAKDVMAYSSTAKVKCSTNTVIVVEDYDSENPITNRITKVTIL